jgi:large subunit ribosomal protein L24
MQRIRKGDTVIVTTGKDKGRTGEVLRVTPSDNRVLVQGVNMVKRHAKQTMNDPGGIQEREAPIHLSNVAHVDRDSNKATRIGYRVLEDGRKVRFAKRTGEQID